MAQLTKAKLELYIYGGDFNNIPDTPEYTLNKSKLSGDDTITFEISELIWPLRGLVGESVLRLLAEDDAALAILSESRRAGDVGGVLGGNVVITSCACDGREGGSGGETFGGDRFLGGGDGLFRRTTCSRRCGSPR